jgi:hypothetical protein
METFIVGKYGELKIDQAVVLKLITMQITHLEVQKRWVQHLYAEATGQNNPEALKEQETALGNINQALHEKKILLEWYKSHS